jgi:hypothetical protein
MVTSTLGSGIAGFPAIAVYGFGGAPKVIEPIRTFSAPATPCTTPPLMLNWNAIHRHSPDDPGR